MKFLVVLQAQSSTQAYIYTDKFVGTLEAMNTNVKVVANR